MESLTRDAAPRTITDRLSDAPDVVVLVICAAVICCAAAMRVNFIGDGSRHLAPILIETSPALGETRWLLFPPFLFSIIKPLQLAGLVNSAAGAARCFLILDVAAGIAYLLLIRQWLVCRSIAAPSRAAALLIAGMTVPILRFSSDIVEVMVPATIALAGLVYLASRPAEDVDRGFWIAASSIALASLLYQGTVLALALLPCAIPRGASVRVRTMVFFCVILAAAPLVMLAADVAGGASLRTALHLMLTGEENQLFRNVLASHRLPILERPLAAATLGTARSIIEIPDNLGFGGSLRLLSHRATLLEGVFAIGGSLIALIMVVAGATVVVDRREWRIATAFAAILMLPIVRGYAYLKLYILMPVVVALVAALSPPAIVLSAGIVVGSFNVTYLARDIARDRQLMRQIAPLYASAGASACWLTTGWGPALFGWPGSICSMSTLLTQARTDRLDLMIAENNAAMAESLRRCFCDSSAIYTDDFVVSSKNSVAEFASYYRYAGPDLSRLLWNPQRGNTAFDSDGIVIFAYSPQAKSDICASLKSAPAISPR